MCGLIYKERFVGYGVNRIYYIVVFLEIEFFGGRRRVDFGNSGDICLRIYGEEMILHGLGFRGSDG